MDGTQFAVCNIMLYSVHLYDSSNVGSVFKNVNIGQTTNSMAKISICKEFGMIHHNDHFKTVYETIFYHIFFGGEPNTGCGVFKGHWDSI